MKKLMLGFVGLWVLRSAFAAATCTWVGTSGNWSDANNWQDGVKPTNGAGDTVVLTCASEGAVIVNDMGEISLAKLTFETPNAVTLRGDAIRLTSTLLTHQAAVVDNNLFVDANVSFNCGEKSYGSAYRPTFNGTVTIADGKLLYIFGNSGANFNAAISGPAGYISFGPSVAACRWDGGTYNFNGPVTVKYFQHEDYGMSSANFYSTSNWWEKITHRYGANYFFHNAGSLPATGTVDFVSSSDRRSPYRGFFLYDDQTVGSIFCSGTCPVVGEGKYTKRDYNWIRNNASKTITLTLRPTCNAKTSCAILMNTHDINLVYDPVDDYTQEFIGSHFTSRTSMTVKGGTLKFTGDTLAQSYVTLDIKDGATFDLDVTNSEALRDIKTINLGKNARLKIGASAVTPFTKKPTVTMDYGAKLVVAEGASIEVGNCTAPNGLMQPVDTYTGSGASGTAAGWIEGGGTVSVATSTSDYVFWKAAVDGTWSENTKWAGDAVPAAGKPVAIARDGASYTVTVDETPAAPSGLVVINDGADQKSTLKVAAPMTVNMTQAKPLTVGGGGRIEVVKDGALTLAASSTQTQALNIKNGGEIEVAGGSMNVTYLPGRCDIAGVEGREGLLKISSGTFTVDSVASIGRLYLGEYGRIAMTGGVFYCPGYTSYYRTFEFVGGTLDLSGDAQFWTAISRTPYHGNGTINLSGNAQFCQHKTSKDAWQSRVYFEPQQESDVLAINVTEHAKYDTSGIIQTDFGGQMGGTVTARFASDQRNYLGAWGYIGTGNSKAVVTLEDGTLATGTYGICIGGPGDTERFKAPYHPEGRLVMTGGALYVYADMAALPSSHFGYGLLVGYSPIFTSGALAGSSAVGTFEMSGGVVTNTYGYTHVGFGAAKGRIVQTGGFFGTSNNKPVAIGAYSGEGEWIVSNGTAQVLGQVYLGGVTTNDFSRPSERDFPEGLAGSKGRLEVAGGRFSSYYLYAGTERGLGSAEVEVGLAGELNVSDAALNNVKLVRKIGDAGTGAFTIEARNGFPGNLTITDKASLEIDASALTNQESGRFTLLTYAGTRTGDFDAAKVTFKGFAEPKNWSVRWVGKRLRCTYSSGMAILVR